MGHNGSGQRFRILERDEFRCRYCGRGADIVSLEVDHVIPRALGGRTTWGNLVAACLECNRGKRARSLTPEVLRRVLQAIVPESVSRPRSGRRGTTHVSRKRARQLGSKCRAANSKKPMLITNLGRHYVMAVVPRSEDFVYVGPDEFLTRFDCEQCGFPNEYEGDGCSCKRRREEGAIAERCDDCGEEKAADGE
ncbi:hypothetical protein LCGC14_2760190, partial [marine sediment metagenome]